MTMIKICGRVIMSRALNTRALVTTGVCAEQSALMPAGPPGLYLSVTE
jgi:hypothetical protein